MLATDSCSVLRDQNLRGPEAPAAAATMQPPWEEAWGWGPRGRGREWSQVLGPCSQSKQLLQPGLLSPAHTCSRIHFELGFLRLANKTPQQHEAKSPARVASCAPWWVPVPGGLGPAAPLWPTLALRPHRSQADPSLDHNHGVMGLIYCRKPLKAQEL